jgi:hypothetical protein
MLVADKNTAPHSLGCLRMPRVVHGIREAIFQGTFFVQVSSFSVHKQRSNRLSPRTFSLIKRLITNVQSGPGKTHAAFGLHYESGEATIRRDISVT